MHPVAEPGASVNLEVRQERDGDALVLLPVDRIYGGNARAFELLLMKFIDGGERRVVIDCSHLEFISSAGLRVLLVSARALETHKGRLAICGMTTGVEEIYRMSGLHRIVPVEASRKAAVAASGTPLPPRPRDDAPRDTIDTSYPHLRGTPAPPPSDPRR